MALGRNPTIPLVVPTPSPGDDDASIATTSFVQNAVGSKAPIASPTLTGTPTAPTPSPGDDDTSIATTAFVTGAVASVEGGGGGGGTITVYASDAFNSSGDYVCDGTADQVQILAAINAVLSGPSGKGTVVLSEGNFSFSAALVMPAGAYQVQLVGQGGSHWFSDEGTTITMAVASGTDPIIDGDTNNITLSLRDINFRQNSTGISSIITCGEGGFIQSCSFSSETSVHHRGIVNLTDSWGTLQLQDCFFGMNGACVWWYKPYNFFIENCYLWTTAQGSATPEYSVEVFADATGGEVDETTWVVRNCFTDGTTMGVVHSYQADGGLIVGNQFWYDDESSIFLEDSSTTVVRDNTFISGDSIGGAIRLDNSDGCSIADNYIFDTHEDGLVLVDSDDNLIQGNFLVDIGYSANDTYSGIFISGDSDRNTIYGNKISNRGAETSYTNKIKYGIRINDATCNDNWVHSNDVIGSYVTAGISDAGTGTVTTSGNRT